MKLRFWPRSLLGQMLLAVAAALLVAQAIAAVLLLRAQDQRREELLMNSIAFRLVTPTRERRFEPPPPGEQRRFRFGLEEVARLVPLTGDRRDAKREERLREVLDREGYDVTDVRVVSRRMADDPFFSQRLLVRIREGLPAPRRLQNQQIVVASIKPTPNSPWTIARAFEPEREPRALGGIVAQTLILYFVLVGGIALLLRRITRPLALLTRRVGHFAETRELHGQLEPEGPEDTRRLIEAHNAMESRIASLLDEKDVMLGAIGHDLKTPLAALRVRIESVEDPTERARMAATIEDITHTLDDILSLARVGRSSDAIENTELVALAASVVEEFEDMGEDVTLADAARIALPVRATWLRRGLRNLVGNALRYGGGAARVSLVREDGALAIRVEDDGPGIPDEELAAMQEPFKRGEASRNRETGGAGLGLTLARAIAEQHGGTLRLANRLDANGTVTGLVADIVLPVAV